MRPALPARCSLVRSTSGGPDMECTCIDDEDGHTILLSAQMAEQRERFAVLSADELARLVEFKQRYTAAEVR